MKDIKKIIDSVVNDFVEKIISQLGEKIESIFIAGSYATGKYSFQCPNVNLYVVSKSNKSSELFIPISKIFHEIRKKFSGEINVVADLRPYRFAYFKPKKGAITLSIRINLFDMKDQDKNFLVPDYVLRGWFSSEKVLYGSDVLKGLKIKVSKDSNILNQKRFILLIVMQQLKHIPLSYDWEEEHELLFYESYEFAKYILSEGLLLKMNEKEIEECLDVQIYDNKEKFVDFYSQRYGEQAGMLARKILGARDHYLEWKDDLNKAIEMYSIAWQLWGLIWKEFQKWSL
jgi:hypothetical protein